MSDTLLNILRGLLGIFVFVIIAYFLSTNKKKINWKLVLYGLVFQFILAFLILKVPVVYDFFNLISQLFVKVYQFSLEGSKFLFGDIPVKPELFGFGFAFRILPSIIFFSALSALFYYLKIIPVLVDFFAKMLRKVMNISGAESLAVAANIFLGHTESPLVIKPFLSKMSKSELHTVVTGGFATITGAVLAALVGILGGDDPLLQEYYATHFLTASVISAPAAIIISKIIIPETVLVDEQAILSNKDRATNIFDSITNGTFDGLQLAINVAGMLLVFISLIAFLNFLLSDIIGHYTGLNSILPGQKGFSMDFIFGIIGAPISWLMGINWSDSFVTGQLIGQKTVFNEIFAYSSLNDMIASGELTNKRSILIISYGLCGFANFGSIGIMIGAIGTLAPNKKSEVASICLRALVSGSLACFITACMAGILE